MPQREPSPETGVQFDFVVAVFSFLDDHTFFNDTVESDVRSRKKPERRMRQERPWR